MKATGKHRERKNGASREQWQKRKAAKNAERGEQIFVAGVYSRVKNWEEA